MCVVPLIQLHVKEKKIRPFPLCPSQFIPWPLLQSSLRFWTNPLSQCPLWKGSVPFTPVSIQDQRGREHFLPSVLPGPTYRPLDELSASQSTLCSLVFTMTPSWESYRSLEPAIKSVKGSNTQTHAYRLTDEFRLAHPVMCRLVPAHYKKRLNHVDQKAQNDLADNRSLWVI